jgi:hypothetical protein
MQPKYLSLLLSLAAPLAFSAPAATPQGGLFDCACGAMYDICIGDNNGNTAAQLQWYAETPCLHILRCLLYLTRHITTQTCRASIQPAISRSNHSNRWLTISLYQIAASNSSSARSLATFPSLVVLHFPPAFSMAFRSLPPFLLGFRLAPL